MFNTYSQQPAGMMGYAYAQPQAQPQMKTPITMEQAQLLQNRNANNFNMNITDEEFLAARCTHKFPTGHQLAGQYATQELPDGRQRCAICGAEFHIIDNPTSVVAENIQNTIDTLQTIKFLYVDIPDEVACNYFQIIPILEQAVKLYTLAAENFNKYTGSPIQQQGGMYGFNAFNNIMAGNMYQPMGQPGMGYAPQAYPQPGMPPMGQPGMAPMGMPQPGMAPMGMPQPGMGMAPMGMQQVNPFGGIPTPQGQMAPVPMAQPGMAPAMPVQGGYAPAPVAADQPVMPTPVPATTVTVTETKSLTV